MLLTDARTAFGKRSSNLELRGAGVRDVDLSAKIDTDAPFMQKIRGEGRGIGETEHAVVGLRIIATGQQGSPADAEVGKVIDIGVIGGKRGVARAELGVDAGGADPETLRR